VIPEDDPTHPQINRALPGWATDAMRFGIPEREARDRRRVWTMAMKIAMSAYRRGWSETEFLTEVKLGAVGGTRRKADNRLWGQLTTRPDGRTRGDAAGYKSLRAAWEAGVANCNNVGMRTKEEIAADAVERAYMWADRITERAVDLTEVEAAVLGFVVSETERRGMLRVTCPCREAAEFAKTSPMTAMRTLKRLARRRLLILHSRGRGGEKVYRRAAIYELADPEALVHRNPG